MPDTECSLQLLLLFFSVPVSRNHTLELIRLLLSLFVLFTTGFPQRFRCSSSGCPFIHPFVKDHFRRQKIRPAYAFLHVRPVGFRFAGTSIPVQFLFSTTLIS